MKQQIREAIKNNLQELSKEELVDTLTDIFMSRFAVSTIGTVSSMQCMIPPISTYLQRVNGQFANIQQPITELEK